MILTCLFLRTKHDIHLLKSFVRHDQFAYGHRPKDMNQITNERRLDSEPLKQLAIYHLEVGYQS